MIFQEFKRLKWQKKGFINRGTHVAMWTRGNATWADTDPRGRLHGMQAKGQVGKWIGLTSGDREVVDFTRSRVKTKSKLTNLMKLIRIEGYNGK